MTETYSVASEEAMMALGAATLSRLRLGDCVLLEGPLGAGKTTFVRGAVRSLGWLGLVRSPTFNLLQIFPTDPPIAHADLFRVSSGLGIGLEDTFDSHVTFIEWPDRLEGMVELEDCIRVEIAFADSGRRLEIHWPEAI